MLNSSSFSSLFKVPFTLCDKRSSYVLELSFLKNLGKLWNSKTVDHSQVMGKVASFINPENGILLGSEYFEYEDQKKHNLFTTLFLRLLSFDISLSAKSYLNDLPLNKFTIENKRPNPNEVNDQEEDPKGDFSINSERWDDVKVKLIDSANKIYEKSKELPISFLLNITKSIRGQLGFAPLFAESTFNFKQIFFSNSSKPIYDLFFLNNIRGYKKDSITPKNGVTGIGGTTAFSLVNKVGLTLGSDKKNEIFGFFDIGVSTRRSIVDSLVKVINDKGNSSCIGKSVGVGALINNSISFAYSIPLTNNINTESFSLSLNANN